MRLSSRQFQVGTMCVAATCPIASRVRVDPAYNLLRGTMVESAKRHDVLPRQLSVKGTMQAVESFTPAMMAIDRCDELYNAFLTTVSAHRVGNRPGRQEPRFKKRRPVWGDYMTIPRHLSRRRLAAAASA